jgi:hypothetical protein
MERLATSPRSAETSSFAGLLASLAAPRKAGEGRESAWNDGALGDDVVTLSYEQAIRNHARYRADERGELPSPVVTETRTDEGPDAGRKLRDLTPRDLRTASVTIRLSKAECAQLHQRAAEAGLTVSAYLRSCVLEADALRAQVKQALAELKIAAKAETASAAAPRPRLSWFRRRTKQK